MEVCVAYGGKFLPSGLSLLRFANRIPLLYDEGSDVSWKIIQQDIDWKYYNIRPETPIGIITHVCSTKVPYKTVGKEYLADRPELERELKNAIRDALRQLKIYLSRKGSIAMVERKMNIYGKYLPLIANFVTDLSGFNKLPNYHILLKNKIIDQDDQVDQEDDSEITENEIKVKEYSDLSENNKEVNKKGEGQTAIEDFS